LFPDGREPDTDAAAVVCHAIGFADHLLRQNISKTENCANVGKRPGN
jgi:hypothetical protein